MHRSISNILIFCICTSVFIWILPLLKVVLLSWSVLILLFLVKLVCFEILSMLSLIFEFILRKGLLKLLMVSTDPLFTRHNTKQSIFYCNGLQIISKQRFPSRKMLWGNSAPWTVTLLPARLCHVRLSLDSRVLHCDYMLDCRKYLHVYETLLKVVLCLENPALSLGLELFCQWWLFSSHSFSFLFLLMVMMTSQQHYGPQRFLLFWATRLDGCSSLW